jgi:hypothetical protein
MKQFIQKLLFLGVAIFALALTSVSYAQSDITEEDKNQQEQRLKEDPRDFAANFIVGAYYYNASIEPHAETTKMKLVEYIEEGAPYEKKKEDLLKKSLPYFENCYAINANSDPRIKEVLKDIYQHLGMLPTARVTTEQLESQLQGLLSKIQFKNIE